MNRVTLLGLALVRLRYQWPLAVAQIAGMAAAVALSAAIPLVQLTASEAGLDRALANLGSGAFVTVEQTSIGSPALYDDFQAQTAKKVAGDTGDRLTPAARYMLGPYFSPFLMNGHEWGQEEPRPSLQFREYAVDHVRLVAGTWPADGRGPDGAYGLAVSQDGSREFVYNLGDLMCVGTAAPRVTYWCGRVTAIWTARSATDPFWGGTVPNHAVLVGRDAYFGIYSDTTGHSLGFGRPVPFGTSVAGQVWAPNISRLRARDMADLADRLNRMRGYFAVQRSSLFSTALDTAVRDFQRRSEVAAFSTQIIAGALLAITLYSVGFLAAHLLEAEADALAVMVGRGYPRNRTWRLLVMQFAIAGAVAVPVGLVAAYALSRGLGSMLFGGLAPPLQAADLPQLLPFLAVVLGGVGVLLATQSLLATRAAGGGGRRNRARQGENAWWRWRNLDLVGAALAIPLLFEVQLHGNGSVRAASSDVSGDPLAIGMPTAALGLLAIASLRLLPLWGRAIGRLTRGVAGSLATWQLERRAAQYARLAVLMVFAVAVGLFSSIYASSDRANAIDRAGYAAGADVRGVFEGVNYSPPDVDGAVAGLPNVAAISQTYRAQGSPGALNINATVLGIPGGSLMNVAWSRPGLDRQTLTELTQELNRRDPDGVTMAGQPQRLSLWTWSSGFAGSLAATVSDDSGQTCTCSFGALDQAGERVLAADIRFQRPAEYPLRLRGLTVSRTGTTAPDGQLAIGQLSAVGAGGPAQPVEAFDKNIGWWHQYQGPISDIGDLYTGVSHPHEGAPTTEFFIKLSRGAFVARPRPSDRAIPALVSTATLSKLGLSVGQSFPMHVDTHVVLVQAIAALDYFPTLYPGREDFLVLPRDTLLGRLGHDRFELAWPNEAWIKLRGSAAPVVRQIRSSPSYLEVDSRQAMTADALLNPLRIALQATLAIGFVAALAMAVLGFGLHFLVAGRGRLSEYAVLQANGLPASQIGRSVLAEQLVVLLHSMVAGAALGLVMAWAIIPAVQVSTDIQDLVPPTILSFDPVSVLAVLVVVALAALVAGGLAGRAAGRFDLVAELRKL